MTYYEAMKGYVFKELMAGNSCGSIREKKNSNKIYSTTAICLKMYMHVRIKPE